MLFEDISLIPSLITRYPRIGYVPKPFYNYYRRANTISTSLVGNMVDIIQAFRNFIETSDQDYREEVIYCVAKQLYWNMMQSRVLFQADFIDLLKEYQKDFLLNPYLAKDGKTRSILDFLREEIIPDKIICVHFGRPISTELLEEIQETLPKTKLIDADERYFAQEQLPENVQTSINNVQDDLGERIGKLVGNISEWTVGYAGDMAKHLPNVLISIIFTILSAYFFIADRDGILEFGRNNTPQIIQEKWKLLSDSFKKVFGGYFKAQFKIMAIIWAILCVGLLFLQVSFAVWLHFLFLFGYASVFRDRDSPYSVGHL